MNAEKSIGDVFTKLESLILSAPDQKPKTQEEIDREEHEEKMRQRDFRLMVALGKNTGWPEKYLEAVKEPPRGEEWLSAFQDAKECVKRNGILVLYGKRGGGKTRMAAELAVMVGRSRYRTAMRFFLEVRATFKKNSEQTELSIVDDMTRADLLVLDEIQERGETAFEDRLLTHVVDARYAAMKPTVLIANLTKGALAESLGNSIVDRARENGKSIEFNWKSYRTQTN